MERMGTSPRPPPEQERGRVHQEEPIRRPDLVDAITLKATQKADEYFGSIRSPIKIKDGGDHGEKQISVSNISMTSLHSKGFQPIRRPDLVYVITKMAGIWTNQRADDAMEEKERDTLRTHPLLP